MDKKNPVIGSIIKRPKSKDFWGCFVWLHFARKGKNV